MTQTGSAGNLLDLTCAVHTCRSAGGDGFALLASPIALVAVAVEVMTEATQDLRS